MTRTALAFTALLAVLVAAGALLASHPTAPTSIPPHTAAAPARPVTAGDAVPARADSARRDTAPTVTAAARTPRQLAHTFAAQQANWSYKTIARQYERLAALSDGQLHTQLRQAAHDVRLDATLRRDRAGTQGHVLGIDIHHDGRHWRIVAATLEESYRDGAASFEGQQARVYLGSAHHTHHGWVMDHWQPQP
jgi:hypothetical protein